MNLWYLVMAYTYIDGVSMLRCVCVEADVGMAYGK
jgi:hypothetical protein